MQQKSKKLIQLLFASTLATSIVPAFAQSNVTVTGLIDNYIGSMQMSGDAKRTSSVNSGGMTTSWLGFNGTEDLGGGLKAKFVLSSFLNTDNGSQGRFPGDTFFSRDANVGLIGGFGTVSIGRDLAPGFLPNILFNPFGDSFAFSPLMVHSYVPLFNSSKWSSTLTGETGWSNEIIYTTPNFGGLTANIHYQFGEVAGESGKNNVGANLLYFNGPLALTAFYNKVEMNNPTNTGPGNVQSIFNPASGVTTKAAEQTAWMIGGTYDLQVAKLFATYGHTSHDMNLQDKTVSLGTSIPAGQGKVLIAWAETDRSGAAVGADQKRDTTSIGYDYDLSKRTDLYANYMNDKITNQNNGNSVGVGIRHRF